MDRCRAGLLGRGFSRRWEDFRSQELTAPFSLEQRTQVTQVVTTEMGVQGAPVLSAGLPLAGLTLRSVLVFLNVAACLVELIDSPDPLPR